MGATISTPKPGIVFTLARGILRPYLWLRFRPIVSGSAHIPESGPVLLVSNHLSALDTILIPSFVGRKVQFLAKESLFTGRVRGWFFRSVGAVPVYRNASNAAQAALDAGLRVLNAGGVFAIFPEGSRSTTGLLHRGRAGAAWTALESGATVIPVGLIGTDLRRDNTGIKPRVEMRIGKPIDLSDLRDLPAPKARREVTDRIMHEISLLSGQQRSAEYASGGRGA